MICSFRASGLRVELRLCLQQNGIILFRWAGALAFRAFFLFIIDLTSDFISWIELMYTHDNARSSDITLTYLKAMPSSDITRICCVSWRMAGSQNDTMRTRQAELCDR